MGQPGTSGATPSSSKRSPGVRIPMEGHSDWNLKFISYDGSEKYVAYVFIKLTMQNLADHLNTRMNYKTERLL